MRRLQEIELAAGQMFTSIGMDLVAEGDPLSEAVLAEYIEDGHAWVVAADDLAVAYLVARVVDDAFHIEQVSVHPSRARQRLGRSLIDLAASTARSTGFDAVTLTTYVAVPWNGPYYARLGFVPVPDEQLTPGLAAIRAKERAMGLDQWPRIAMARHLRGATLTPG